MKYDFNLSLNETLLCGKLGSTWPMANHSFINTLENNKIDILLISVTNRF